MKLSWLVAMVASGVMGLMASATTAPSQWEQPAAALAEEIAGILGPGQAHLTIRNNSSIPTDEIPAIRRLLMRELKTRGVTTAETETANLLRITLSESLRERLWVAEIVEGNETRVAMVHVELVRPQQIQAQTGLTLRSQTVIATEDRILTAANIAGALVVVEPEEIAIFSHAPGDWKELKRAPIGQRRFLVRDPRAVILPVSEGRGFFAWLSGAFCSGTSASGQVENIWEIHCQERDDPWPIAAGSPGQLELDAKGENATQMNVDVAPIKAFYNSSRNYFTGVLSPSEGTDLPPFYSAALIPRHVSGGGLAAFLFNGIDGKVQLVENSTLKPVSGTRDWGSDFAALNSGCGAGTQIIASGSGEAAADSLRAYELPAQEAVPASAPLAMEGTVTALWSALDGKSIFAVVRRTASPGSADSYEVDRVTASCN